MPAPQLRTMPHVSRTISGLAGGAGTAIRRAKFDGIEHIIVPVVCAIGGMVVWPMNATGWELVPEEELAAYPVGWNGRPILPDHPHGGALSANDPETLARLRFGYMFATRYANGALQTEAWLDPVRAKQVGLAAESVIARALAGELIEVSVGAGIITDPTPGITADGREYSSIWRDIIPDHLAMLPADAIGACSVEMGCGAPRELAQSAMARLRTAQVAVLGSGSATSTSPATVVGRPKGESMKPKILSALYRLVAGEAQHNPASAAGADGVSYNEIFDVLWTALYNEEPAMGGIVDIWPDKHKVVFSTYADNTRRLFQRTYTVSDSGDVTLNNDREEVRETEPAYEVVTASSAGATSPPCACHTNASTASTATNSGAASGATAKETDMNKDKLKAAVARLHRGAATEEDKALLATELGMTPEELAPPVTTAPAPAVTPPAPTDTAAVPSPAAAPALAAPAAPAQVAAKSPEDLERDWLASNPPPHLVQMADRFKAEELSRRAHLAAAIAAASAGFTPEELAAMPTSGGPGSLERTYTLLGLASQPGPSFLGRPFPAPAVAAAGMPETTRRRYEGPMARAARAKQQSNGGSPAVDPDDVAN